MNQRFFSSILIMILFLAGFSSQAQATVVDQSLVNEEFCLAVPESANNSNHLYDGFFGLSCSQLKKLDQLKGTVTSVAIVSAKQLFSNPTVKAQLINRMIAAGYFAAANPAVAAVTIIGAYGITQFYVALNASIEECEFQDRVQLELRIRKELNEKYNL